MLFRTVLNSLVGGILAAIVVVRIAAASPYTTIYAFGDSLSDAGNLYIATHGLVPVPPYSDGRFTNGPVWVQDLSQALGLGPLTPSLLGGTDFAFGDAETGTTLVHTASPIDLPGQLSAFEAAVPAPQPHALYTLWIGSNDLLDILASTLNPAQMVMAGMQAIANIDTFVTGIAQDGAHNLLVLTVPDLGKTPLITSMSPGASLVASAFTLTWDQALLASLLPIEQTFDLNLRTVDTFSLIDEAVDDPARFGFTNVTDPCWTGGYFGPPGTLCALGMTDQDKYLFWDHVHPTARGHALVADAALNAIPEPPAWSMLVLGLWLIGLLRYGDVLPSRGAIRRR
jgi:phospholipase/lecithinase/hemolysin